MTAGISFRDLADRLAAGLAESPPGTRLPSENELQELHDVSRQTTRAALQELERRNLVRRVRGSGTYTAVRIPYPIRSGMAPSWSAHVRAAGHEPSHQLLAATTERSSAALARLLLIARGRTVSTIDRLGFVDGAAASWHRSHVPLDIAPNLAQSAGLEGSLTRVLSNDHSLVVERWWSRAELESVPETIAPHLELAPGDTAWHITSLNVCRQLGRPVEQTDAWLRADSFRVFLELGPTDHGPLLDFQGPA